MAQALRPELLARYAHERVPRYTSYPAAPHFKPDVSAATYEEWLHALRPGSASLYVHIPFCAEMCWYCGCHTTVSRREAPVSRYLDALYEELSLVGAAVQNSLAISHLHLGGGTPTIMAPEQMLALITRIRNWFHFSPKAEIAIEIDPRTFTAEMADALAEAGFNRASLGVQSFDPAVQQAINRRQSFEQTTAAVDHLRGNGVERINFDLIYGLPHQSVASCLETVEQALRLAPDRLAVFGYAHVPAFKPHQRKIQADALAGPDERFIQSRAIADALIAGGYVEVGLDHFASPDDPLAIAANNGCLHRNFQGYTTDAAEVLIGLGASAIGRMPGGFVQNEVRIPHYQRSLQEGRLPTARGYRFTGEDRLRGAVIERLMCDYRVDLSDICRRFAADPSELLAGADLDRFAADGLIDRSGAELKVRPHARPLVRSIAAAFDTHLAPPECHSRAV